MKTYESDKTTGITPGPWEHFDAKNEHGEATISIRGNSEFIATMDLMATNGGPYLLPPNAEANARLIAAAPDLLEACKAIAAHIPENDVDIPTFAGINLARIVRAAIAKAEGASL
jgi:hypothetical protein